MRVVINKGPWLSDILTGAEVTAVVSEKTNEVARRYRDNVPVRTGNLQYSIFAEVVREKDLKYPTTRNVGIAGTPLAAQAKAVEYGTRSGSPARHPLKRAAESMG